MRQFRVMSVMTTSIRLRVNYLVIIINLGANVKAKIIRSVNITIHFENPI